MPKVRKIPKNTKMAHKSGTKIQPKEEVFGRRSLRTSGQKLRSGPPNPGKISILAPTSRADVHEKNFGLKNFGLIFRSLINVRKIRAPIKIKSALPPPPPNPPLKRRNFTDMVFPAERTHFFQVSIKLAHPFPAPELRTRILRTRGFFWYFCSLINDNCCIFFVFS